MEEWEIAESSPVMAITMKPSEEERLRKLIEDIREYFLFIRFKVR